MGRIRLGTRIFATPQDAIGWFEALRRKCGRPGAEVVNSDPDTDVIAMLRAAVALHPRRAEIAAGGIDRFAWPVDLDKSGPCWIAAVRADGSVQPFRLEKCVGR